MKKVILAVIALLVFGICNAATWYVNVDADSTSAMNGRSPYFAYRNLSELSYNEHDNIASNDVVFIAPGTYDALTVFPMNNWSLWTAYAGENAEIVFPEIGKNNIAIIATGRNVILRSSVTKNNLRFFKSMEGLQIKGIIFGAIAGNSTHLFDYCEETVSYGCSFFSRVNDEVSIYGSGNFYDCNFYNESVNLFRAVDSLYFSHCIFHTITSGIIKDGVFFEFASFENCILKNGKIARFEVDITSKLSFKNCIYYGIIDSFNIENASVSSNNVNIDPLIVWDIENIEFNFDNNSPALNNASDNLDIGTLNRVGIFFEGK